MNLNPILNFRRRRRTAKVHGWINDRRDDLGLEPIDEIPKGNRRATYRCPVAMAFRPHTADVAFSRTLVLSRNPGVERYFFHPPFVVEWILDFDENGAEAFGRKR